MANIIDYVKWRGDISFEESEVNALDALIFSELVYLSFDDIVPSSVSTKGVLLPVLLDKYFSLHYDAFTTGAVLPIDDILELFKLCAASRRFSSVTVKGFVNDIDIREEKQFGAVCFDVGKSTTVVAFRGTDDTLVGWKENLNMAFFTPIPAQNHGNMYLKDVILNTDKERFVVCGHSKGGNIAVYASLYLDETIQNKIHSVYSFDGPGFKMDLVESARTCSLVERMYQISPEDTMIGAIFNHFAKCIYVKSSVKGSQQHDAFTWQVLGKDFVYAVSATKGSIEFHNILERLVENMSDKERVDIVEAIYKFLTVNDATTLTDIASDKRKFLLGVLKTDMKTKATLFDFMNRFVKEKYFSRSDSRKREEKLLEEKGETTKKT